ncbi:hypothetical protein H696_03454 [Fonticula alba]|uniref:Uncharacterized protein n=1 Tax=Fonticula alba TaxID=691883 RepID=A0A058Z6U6_FONAL|nr:hypothetical protein H696_03454 [Fonticula alba]KCV69989.1 hypothetical protein H696_03454 [Fonticula alba]|eukprot:XP_009495595.1 hypothetical protein H696_03454 [Fonticula alba]
MSPKLFIGGNWKVLVPSTMSESPGPRMAAGGRHMPAGATAPAKNLSESPSSPPGDASPRTHVHHLASTVEPPRRVASPSSPLPASMPPAHGGQRAAAETPLRARKPLHPSVSRVSYSGAEAGDLVRSSSQLDLLSTPDAGTLSPASEPSSAMGISPSKETVMSRGYLALAPQLLGNLAVRVLPGELTATSRAGFYSTVMKLCLAMMTSSALFDSYGRPILRSMVLFCGYTLAEALSVHANLMAPGVRGHPWLDLLDTMATAVLLLRSALGATRMALRAGASLSGLALGLLSVCLGVAEVALVGNRARQWLQAAGWITPSGRAWWPAGGLRETAAAAPAAAARLSSQPWTTHVRRLYRWVGSSLAYLMTPEPIDPAAGPCDQPAIPQLGAWSWQEADRRGRSWLVVLGLCFVMLALPTRNFGLLALLPGLGFLGLALAGTIDELKGSQHDSLRSMLPEPMVTWSGNYANRALAAGERAATFVLPTARVVADRVAGVFLLAIGLARAFATRALTLAVDFAKDHDLQRFLPASWPIWADRVVYWAVWAREYAQHMLALARTYIANMSAELGAASPPPPASRNFAGTPPPAAPPLPAWARPGAIPANGPSPNAMHGVRQRRIY